MNNKENLYLQLCISWFRLANENIEREIYKRKILDFIGNDNILDYSLSEIKEGVNYEM